MATKIEFTLEIPRGTSDSVEEKIRQSLDSCTTTRITELDPVSGRVVLDTDRPWSELLSKIETTGLRAALTGFGGSAAVSIVDKGDVPGAQGVIRFTAATPDVKQLVLDGVVDGLQPNENLHVQIHECGDVSRGCSSIGDRYGEPVGSTKTSDEGRMAFRFSDEQFSISDLIGRSVCLADDSGKRLTCGIIARAAGVNQNFKKICACDGITLWDERNVPAAGGTRATFNKTPHS